MRFVIVNRRIFVGDGKLIHEHKTTRHYDPEIGCGFQLNSDNDRRLPLELGGEFGPYPDCMQKAVEWERDAKQAHYLLTEADFLRIEVI